jgi:hypothetical protein
MKRTQLICLSLLYAASSNLFSQTTYHKLLGDSNTWYVSGMMVFFAEKPLQKQSSFYESYCLGSYEANTDSLVNGKKYKIVSSTSTLCQQSSPIQPYRALLREDTLSRKIYFIEQDSTSEKVVMDFGLANGDSIYLDWPQSNQILTSGFYKLDSTRNLVELCGLRKHFFLSKYNAPINTITNKKYFIEWIESVGATHFPVNIIEESSFFISGLNAACSKNQYASFVTCKWTNTIKYFQDSCSVKYIQAHPLLTDLMYQNTCEFYVYSVGGGFSEIPFLQQVKLFPNPYSDNLFLQFEASDFKPIDLVVFNSLGQVIYKKHLEISTPSNVIELNNLNLKPGIYDLQIKSRTQSMTIKFIKN